MSDIQAPSPAADVATALAQPAACPVPAARSGDVTPPSAPVGQPVGGRVSALLAVLTPILRMLATSKTQWGVVGMLGLQILGPDGLDWGLYHGNEHYSLAGMYPYIASGLAALATWGRITAKPPKGSSNA